jgi:uncharacterized RmlC-like cupin family protein
MEIRVLSPPDFVPETASGAMLRQAAVSQRTVGAQKLWVGYVELGPGLRSALHHHGECESVIYIIGGRARFLVGDHLESSHDAVAGDFVWVPPHVPHVEMNMSDMEPVRMVVARSTQESLVFNLPTPESETMQQQPAERP